MKPEIKAYLKRIGFEGVPKNDFATLRQLQIQHLKTVPYENLDIMRNIPLSLEVGDMYEKIVVRNRGGYCFELNGLFAWLLRALDFKVTEYMARFLRDEKEIPMRRHRVLKVACTDGDYLGDVGVGSMVPRIPLPLVLGKVSEQGAERYKLEKEPFLGTVLYEWRRGEWSRLYAFTEEEQLNIDYVMPSFYCEKHPESYFRTMDMVHIFTDDGRKSVAGREFKIFSADGVEVMVPGSEVIYKELLARHFGITI
ncbi:MAG: arylamine N-acetyltransferase [Defluviitaleaceae bacterium]|nr:arylamine N-acetyltransferase [Defluviitaleaceae bacterium]